MNSFEKEWKDYFIKGKLYKFTGPTSFSDPLIYLFLDSKEDLLGLKLIWLSPGGTIVESYGSRRFSPTDYWELQSK